MTWSRRVTENVPQHPQRNSMIQLMSRALAILQKSIPSLKRNFEEIQSALVTTAEAGPEGGDLPL